MHRLALVGGLLDDGVPDDGQLLLEAPPDLGHVVPDEDEHGVRVVGLHLEQLGHKVLVVDHASAVGVKDGEHQMHVVLVHVHGHQLSVELRIELDPLEQLLQGEVAARIGVELATEASELHFHLRGLLLLVRFDMIIVLLARLHGGIYDHRKHHIHDGKVYGDEDSKEEPPSQRRLLHDGYRDLPPAIPCNDLLREGDHRVGNGREGGLAPVAASVKPLQGHPLVHRMDELDCADAPHREDYEQQPDPVHNRAEGVCKAFDHQRQLGELHDNLIASGQSKHAEDPQHRQRGEGIRQEQLHQRRQHVYTDYHQVHDVEEAEKKAGAEDEEPDTHFQRVNGQQQVVCNTQPSWQISLSVRLHDSEDERDHDEHSETCLGHPGLESPRAHPLRS
mmetsp:Transcript_78341/g.207988  ORF Transcript_78341/g.207988 Transcript_78341/m.207988 type:complete len:391 (+) Transcript_78341:636-1808(+)